MGGLLGGGGGKGYVGPPLKLLGAWPPTSYAYGNIRIKNYTAPIGCQIDRGVNIMQ